MTTLQLIDEIPHLIDMAISDVHPDDEVVGAACKSGVWTIYRRNEFGFIVASDWEETRSFTDHWDYHRERHYTTGDEFATVTENGDGVWSEAHGCI